MWRSLRSLRLQLENITHLITWRKSGVEKGNSQLSTFKVRPMGPQSIEHRNHFKHTITDGLRHCVWHIRTFTHSYIVSWAGLNLQKCIIYGSEQVPWTWTGRNKTLPSSTSLPVMDEIACVNTISQGRCPNRSKTMAGWGRGGGDVPRRTQRPRVRHLPLSLHKMTTNNSDQIGSVAARINRGPRLPPYTRTEVLRMLPVHHPSFVEETTSNSRNGQVRMEHPWTQLRKDTGFSSVEKRISTSMAWDVLFTRTLWTLSLDTAQFPARLSPSAWGQSLFTVVKVYAPTSDYKVNKV